MKEFILKEAIYFGKIGLHAALVSIILAVNQKYGYHIDPNWIVGIISGTALNAAIRHS